MAPWLGRCALGLTVAAALALTVAAQIDPDISKAQHEDVRLPNGKLQRDEILKAEHEQNLKDATALTEMAQQLQQELEKEDYSILSMTALKKTDDIEKLAKKIRSRLRHN